MISFYISFGSISANFIQFWASHLPDVLDQILTKKSNQAFDIACCSEFLKECGFGFCLLESIAIRLIIVTPSHLPRVQIIQGSCDVIPLLKALDALQLLHQLHLPMLPEYEFHELVFQSAHKLLQSNMKNLQIHKRLFEDAQYRLQSYHVLK